MFFLFIAVIYLIMMMIIVWHRQNVLIKTSKTTLRVMTKMFILLQKAKKEAE